jgi:hypothetical protein
MGMGSKRVETFSFSVGVWKSLAAAFLPFRYRLLGRSRGRLEGCRIALIHPHRMITGQTNKSVMMMDVQTETPHTIRITAASPTITDGQSQSQLRIDDLPQEFNVNRPLSKIGIDAGSVVCPSISPRSEKILPI